MGKKKKSPSPQRRLWEKVYGFSSLPSCTSRKQNNAQTITCRSHGNFLQVNRRRRCRRFCKNDPSAEGVGVGSGGGGGRSVRATVSLSLFFGRPAGPSAAPLARTRKLVPRPLVSPSRRAASLEVFCIKLPRRVPHGVSHTLHGYCCAAARPARTTTTS